MEILFEYRNHLIFLADHNLLQGELERELLQTYDPANIATLLTKITPQLHRKAIAEQVVTSITII